MAAVRPMTVIHHARRAPVLRYTVRTVIAAVVAAVVVGIGVLSFSHGAGGKIQLTVYWWGGQARATITTKVLDLYTQRHPNVVFKTQWQGNSGYYDKLATMATGGTAPDLFQIDDNGLTEYASRGITLNLRPYLGSKIKVSEFPAALQGNGAVGNRVAGIVAAENTPAMVYDRTAIQALGLPLPSEGMSWTALIDWAAQVYTASHGKLYGTMNPSADYKALQVWLRQQGKDLYNGGNLGFTQADLVNWLQMWATAQDRHASPPADIVHNANTGDVTKQLVETGQAATSFMWSNQLEELQKGTQHQLGLSTYPGNPAGQWLRASMYWSAYAGTKHQAQVLDVINFLVNDPDAGRILGAERGLAPNMVVRTEVAPTLTPAMQASVTFEDGVAKKAGTTPAPPPAGHSQIRTQLLQAAESVEYRKATPAQAAAQFFKQAKTILSA